MHQSVLDIIHVLIDRKMIMKSLKTFMTTPTLTNIP